MLSSVKLLAVLGATLLVAGSLSACGSKSITLASNDPNMRGATLFRDRCSGCHTLDTVGAQGSATSIKSRLRTNGPNFNQRKEQVNQVLYAIRNGGFSGAIMPEDIVLGSDAQAIATFLSKYSGLKVQSVPTGQGKSTPIGPNPVQGSS